MSDLQLHVRDVSKNYNRRAVFRGVTASVAAPGSLAITGRNGAGKSTLVKIMAGVLSATSGAVEVYKDGIRLQTGELRTRIGFVSPYLQLYDEFTAIENLRLLTMIRSNEWRSDAEGEASLELVGLLDRRDDPVRTFSSGMKQRLKYALATLHRPAMLILDEPTANLDAEGIGIVVRLVERQRGSEILVVATNDEREASWCTQRISLGG